MFCFPITEKLTLGQELLQCVYNNELEILITQVVVDELFIVVRRSKAHMQYYDSIINLLDYIGVLSTPTPDAAKNAEIDKFCVDANDIKITSAAISLKDTHDYHYLVSNDIKNFHNDEMKAYLAEYGITPLTMFGLLKLLGKR